MTQSDRASEAHAKKPYSTPSIEPKGRVEEITRWIGGWWGEFFHGQGSGWNPWSRPGGGS